MNRISLACFVAILLFLLPVPGFAQDDADCMNCHGDADLVGGLPNGDRLLVDLTELHGSIHGPAEVSCVYCHQGLAGDNPFPHPKDLKPVNCGGCHREEKKVFAGSLHGYALERGNPRAPDCVTCHGGHGVLRSDDPKSPTHQRMVPETCAKCHGTAGLLTDQIVKLPESFLDYNQSVHGKAASRGIGKAASCADCHEVHDLRSAADPLSPINPRNQAVTCGKCHPDVQREYDRSIHGRAIRAGVLDSPTCTDCHGEHMILSPDDPEASTSAQNLAIKTCGRCHDDPILVAKYNMKGGVVGSYVDSYHGWATAADHKKAATCVSCHTVHSILPASVPTSSIHPDNVVQTCAKCHEGASVKFSQSYTHDNNSMTENPINRTIRSIYIVLIALVIGSMVLHNLIVMNYYMMQRRKEEAASRWFRRFDKVQIAQHLLLTISFTLLAITGFALRYPDAWWVRQLAAIGMTEEVRAMLHRIFAVVLICTSISHVWYVFLTRRGRSEIKAMLPSLKDARDVVGNLGYYTWRTGKKVKFGRYDYSQKAEYWALIWGTILMIVTGFVLWFPVAAVKIAPSWIVTASQTVHFYEGVLATLAILVWHFFFVVFHPEEYPMSWTWLTGKMSEESVRKHHAKWYEEETGKPADESSTE